MTVDIRLSGDLADEMVAHCEAGLPNEACGMLGNHNGEVVKIFRMTNAAGSPVRYALDPREQLAVYNTLEDKGWDLGGVFHSHTHTAAFPSPTDVRLASEDVPYLIVSLAAAPVDMRAWRILKESWRDDHGEIVEVPVTIVG